MRACLFRISLLVEVCEEFLSKGINWVKLGRRSNSVVDPFWCYLYYLYYLYYWLLNILSADTIGSIIASENGLTCKASCLVYFDVFLYNAGVVILANLNCFCGLQLVSTITLSNLCLSFLTYNCAFCINETICGIFCQNYCFCVTVDANIGKGKMLDDYCYWTVDCWTMFLIKVVGMILVPCANLYRNYVGWIWLSYSAVINDLDFLIRVSEVIWRLVSRMFWKLEFDWFGL